MPYNPLYLQPFGLDTVLVKPLVKIPLMFVFIDIDIFALFYSAFFCHWWIIHIIFTTKETVQRHMIFLQLWNSNLYITFFIITSLPISIYLPKFILPHLFWSSTTQPKDNNHKIVFFLVLGVTNFHHLVENLIVFLQLAFFEDFGLERMKIFPDYYKEKMEP